MTNEFPSRRFSDQDFGGTCVKGESHQDQLAIKISSALITNPGTKTWMLDLPRFAQEQIIYDITSFAWDYVVKFALGYIEHGGNLDEMSAETLNDHQRDEQLDAWAYRMAIERKSLGHEFYSVDQHSGRTLK